MLDGVFVYCVVIAEEVANVLLDQGVGNRLVSIAVIVVSCAIHLIRIMILDSLVRPKPLLYTHTFRVAFLLLRRRLSSPRRSWEKEKKLVKVIGLGLTTNTMVSWPQQYCLLTLIHGEF